MSITQPNKEAALRLKHARSLTGFARTVFCKKHNMSSNTMAAWENGTTYFSEEAAKKVAKYLHQDGIEVSPEWILEGKGSEPFTLDMRGIHNTPFIRSSVADEEEFIWRATTSFKEFYKDCLVLIMVDDTALPFFRPGDHIGGKIIPLDQLPFIEDEPLIVELESGSLMFRYVEKTSKPGLYHLKSINQDTVMGALIKNVKIKRAARINWIFKR